MDWRWRLTITTGYVDRSMWGIDGVTGSSQELGDGRRCRCDQRQTERDDERNIRQERCAMERGGNKLGGGWWRWREKEESVMAREKIIFDSLQW